MHAPPAAERPDAFAWAKSGPPFLGAAAPAAALRAAALSSIAAGSSPVLRASPSPPAALPFCPLRAALGALPASDGLAGAEGGRR